MARAPRIAAARPASSGPSSVHRRARARALRRLVRDVPALGRHRSNAQRARSTKREARLPYVAAMGFDVLYLPPIHPIGRSFRKGPNNTLDAAARRSGQPLGDRRGRGRPQGDPARARHARRFRSLRRTAAQQHGLEIALDIAFQARPIIPTCASIRSGSAIGPTARSSTPRTRRRSTRTSIRSTSSATTGRRCGTSCKSVFEFWIGHGVTHLPRRQPAHQAVRASGSGCIARGQARASRRDLPRRGVHAAEGDAPPGEARLHAVVHLLHLAQHQGGADRVLHRADADAGARVHAAEPVRRTRPTSCTNTCSTAAGRRSMARLVLAATLGASYGIYGRLRAAARTCRCEPAARSTSTRRSTRSALGLRHARTASRELIARVNAIRREHPRAAARPGPALPRDRQRPADLPTARRRADGRDVRAGRRQPRPAPHAARLRRAAARRAGPARRDAAVQVHDLLSGERYLWRGARNYVRLDPQHRAWRTSCIVQLRSSR